MDINAHIYTSNAYENTNLGPKIALIMTHVHTIFDQNQKLNSTNTMTTVFIYRPICAGLYDLRSEVLVYVCMQVCVFILMNLPVELET